MAEAHDMTQGGQGSTSRFNTAGNQDPTESASRNLAARRREQIAGMLTPSHNDMMAEHYEERAARKEADQRELEAYRAQQKEDAEWRKREEWRDRWMASDEARDLTVSPYSDPGEELDAARKRHADFMQRAEGDELAAQIITRAYHY
ncbi:hypothetical protein [Streptomyces sp. NPDC017260]|uniref:hypothetical protein n=1 Tax=unclassified Streptomyces TaxID=2593676 RepID=UPI0037AE5D7F